MVDPYRNIHIFLRYVAHATICIYRVVVLRAIMSIKTNVSETLIKTKLMYIRIWIQPMLYKNGRSQHEPNKAII